jgi:intracellular sulfur oxidation DsrE/DsrF family protein
MKSVSTTIILGMVLSGCLLFLNAVSVFGEEYEVLKGLDSVKTVFDVRTGNPKSAAMQLDLIHLMFKDKRLRKVTEKPEFVLVFIGPAVKLISTQTEGFSPEAKEKLGKIANTISEMAKDGIKLEICLFAANALGVDPASLLPEIKHVGNGWISLIGYQAKGYSLVPVY